MGGLFGFFDFFFLMAAAAPSPPSAPDAPEAEQNHHTVPIVPPQGYVILCSAGFSLLDRPPSPPKAIRFGRRP